MSLSAATFCSRYARAVYAASASARGGAAPRGNKARRCAVRRRLAPLTILFLAAATLAAEQTRSAFAPEGTPISLGLAGYAKVLCSAVFVSGRDPAEAFRNSGYFFFPEDQQSGVSYVVDRDKKLVRMTHGAITRTAKFYGDQGCIIHPEGHDGIFFTPVAVKTRLPDASGQAWPMGDKDPPDAVPSDLDQS